MSLREDYLNDKNNDAKREAYFLSLGLTIVVEENHFSRMPDCNYLNSLDDEFRYPYGFVKKGVTTYIPNNCLIKRKGSVITVITPQVNQAVKIASGIKCIKGGLYLFNGTEWVNYGT